MRVLLATTMVSCLVWMGGTIAIGATQRSARRPPAPRPSAARPTPPADSAQPPLAPGMRREVPLMQCPSVLGNGIKTQRLFCDVLTGADPAAGLRISIPVHQGRATLFFTLHNRQAAADTADDATDKTDKPGKGFARYTASLRVVTPDGRLLRQTVVQSEFRGPADIVERIAGGAGRGGVKAVAPTGSEPIALDLPPGITDVSLLGEKLTVERLDGTEVVTAAGRPIAVVSQVQVEYRPEIRR